VSVTDENMTMVNTMGQVNSNEAFHNVSLDYNRLRDENRDYNGTAGVSRGCFTHCFFPAFLDNDSGVIYLSRYADGRPAPFHTLEGMPEEVIIRRSPDGKIAEAKRSLVSGFVKCGMFYTRSQAAMAI
jgi:hypothetical protein